MLLLQDNQAAVAPVPHLPAAGASLETGCFATDFACGLLLRRTGNAGHGTLAGAGELPAGGGDDEEGRLSGPWDLRALWVAIVAVDAHVSFRARDAPKETERRLRVGDLLCQISAERKKAAYCGNRSLNVPRSKKPFIKAPEPGVRRPCLTTFLIKHHLNLLR
jgi:hypothetical protein